MEWIQEIFRILPCTRFYNKLDMRCVRKRETANVDNDVTEGDKG